MRRHAAVAIVAVAVLLAQPGVLQAGERRTAVTYDCRHVQVQPRSIMFACGDGGFFVRRLDWRTWHPFRAFARGVFHQNDCRPSCAGGTFHTREGTLRLRGRTWCPDIRRYVFDHAVVKFDAPLVGRDEQRFRMFCP